MICYQDRTFCINKECPKKCSIYLTEKIKKKADDFGLPVCVQEWNWQECLSINRSIIDDKDKK